MTGIQIQMWLKYLDKTHKYRDKAASSSPTTLLIGPHMSPSHFRAEQEEPTQKKKSEIHLSSPRKHFVTGSGTEAELRNICSSSPVQKHVLLLVAGSPQTTADLQSVVMLQVGPVDQRDVMLTDQCHPVS